MLLFALQQSRGRGRIGLAIRRTPSANVVPGVQVVTAVLESISFLFRSLLLDKEEDALCDSKRPCVAPYYRSAFRPKRGVRLGPGGPSLSSEVCLRVVCRKVNFHPKRTLFSIGGMSDFTVLMCNWAQALSPYTSPSWVGATAPAKIPSDETTRLTMSFGEKLLQTAQRR